MSRHCVLSAESSNPGKCETRGAKKRGSGLADPEPPSSQTNNRQVYLYTYPLGCQPKIGRNIMSCTWADLPIASRIADLVANGQLDGRFQPVLCCEVSPGVSNHEVARQAGHPKAT